MAIFPILHPFWAEPPRIAIYRENPPPPPEQERTEIVYHTLQYFRSLVKSLTNL